VEGGGWREDVLEVLGAGLLEAVQRGVGEVLGQALVVQAVAGQRHRLVLGQRHADDLTVHLLAIKVAHGFGEKRGRSRGGHTEVTASLTEPARKNPSTLNTAKMFTTRKHLKKQKPLHSHENRHWPEFMWLIRTLEGAGLRGGGA